MQPAQGEGFLGGHPQDPHHLPALGACLLTELLDERGLADTGFPDNDHCPFGVPGQQPRQPSQFSVPAHQRRTSGHDPEYG